MFSLPFPVFLGIRRRWQPLCTAGPHGGDGHRDPVRSGQRGHGRDHAEAVPEDHPAQRPGEVHLLRAEVHRQRARTRSIIDCPVLVDLCVPVKTV